MTIALYLLLVSPGLGFETGYGAGSFFDDEQHLGRKRD